MACQNLKYKTMNNLFTCSILFQTSFHLLTVNLLALSIPLSFLLLARLSSYNYLSTLTTHPFSPPSSFIFLLFRYTTPPILYTLISLLSVSTLIHNPTGKISLLYHSKLYIGWILLCTLQFCVGLGIEETISAGIEGYKTDVKRSLFSRVIFFLGLHETMLYWCRMVVKPVVDDTVFGEARDEKWFQRVAVAASFGGFWWWRLRDEIEALVLVAESKRDLKMGLGLDDFVAWWLYYITVSIGMTRIVKGILWVGSVLVFKRRARVGVNGNCNGLPDNEEKV